MIQLYAAIWLVSEPRQIVLILLSVAAAALAAAPSKFQQEIVNILTEESFEVSRLYLLAGGMIAVILLSSAWNGSWTIVRKFSERILSAGYGTSFWTAQLTRFAHIAV